MGKIKMQRPASAPRARSTSSFPNQKAARKRPPSAPKERRPESSNREVPTAQPQTKQNFRCESDPEESVGSLASWSVSQSNQDLGAFCVPGCWDLVEEQQRNSHDDYDDHDDHDELLTLAIPVTKCGKRLQA